jgi:hypothetical protein
MLGSLFQRRGFSLFLLVVIPAALFAALFWTELNLLAGPVLMVLGLAALVISFMPTWVGTDPATGNAPPQSMISSALMLGGVLLNVFGLPLTLLALSGPPLPQTAWHAAQALVCQGVGFSLVFGLLLVILPRFVLPAQTRAQRRQVRGRLWLYLLGQHGPVVIVKNGQRSASTTEEKVEDFKPGVAVLDSFSAIALERKFPVQQPAERRQWRGSLAAQLYELEKYLASGQPGMGEVVAAGLYWARWLRLAPRRVLRQWLLRQHLIRPRPAKPPRLARVEGPGLVFIEADEMVRDTLDLRPQFRARPSIKALTRDGIEVESTLTVIFRLQSTETRDATGQTEAIERNLPAFSFTRESAFRAVYGSPVAKFEPDARALSVKHWTDLPAFVASDIFRDLILTRTLDDLFYPTSTQDFPLDNLRQEFSRRVKADAVLSERGIQVDSANFGRLTVPPAVAEQRLSSWRADWIRQSLETVAAGDLQVARIIQRARTNAQYDLIRQMSAMLKQTDSNAVVLLPFIQALERTSTDPQTRRLLPAETIQVIRGWMNQLSKGLPPQTSGSAAGNPTAGSNPPEPGTTVNQEESRPQKPD